MSEGEAKEQCRTQAAEIKALELYRQEEQANEDEWDNGTAVKPPLGEYTGGQPDKEKQVFTIRRRNGEQGIHIYIYIHIP